MTCYVQATACTGIVNVNVNHKFLVWLEYQRYYKVHGGAVESQLGKNCEKRNVFNVGGRQAETGMIGCQILITTNEQTNNT